MAASSQTLQRYHTLSHDPPRLPSIRELNFGGYRQEQHPGAPQHQQHTQPQHLPHQQLQLQQAQPTTTSHHHQQLQQSWPSRQNQQHPPPHDVQMKPQRDSAGYVQPGLPLSAQTHAHQGMERSPAVPHKRQRIVGPSSMSTAASRQSYANQQYSAYPQGYQPVPVPQPHSTPVSAPTPVHAPVAVPAPPQPQPTPDVQQHLSGYGVPAYHQYIQAQPPSRQPNTYSSPGPSAPPPQGPWSHPQHSQSQHSQHSQQSQHSHQSQHSQQAQHSQQPQAQQSQQAHPQAHQPQPLHLQQPHHSASHPHTRHHPQPQQVHQLQQQQQQQHQHQPYQQQQHAQPIPQPIPVQQQRHQSQSMPPPPPPQHQPPQQHQPQQIPFHPAARSSTLTPLASYSTPTHSHEEPQRTGSLHDIHEQCRALCAFANRYAQLQSRMPQHHSSPTHEPRPEELSDMSAKARSVVKLLEEFRRANGLPPLNPPPPLYPQHTPSQYPQTTNQYGQGQAQNALHPQSHGAPSSPDDHRPPKRPWEDMSHESHTPRPPPQESVDPYAHPAHDQSTSATPPSDAGGSGAGTSAPITTAEQDMEIIKAKRASTTAAAAAGATGVGSGGPVIPGAGATLDGSAPGGASGKNKYKKRSRATPPGKCHSCNIRETPEWRRGPDGARTLCNACGLHYAKMMRRKDKNGEGGGKIDMETLRASARAAEHAAANLAGRSNNPESDSSQYTNGNADASHPSDTPVMNHPIIVHENPGLQPTPKPRQPKIKEDIAGMGSMAMVVDSVGGNGQGHGPIPNQTHHQGAFMVNLISNNTTSTPTPVPQQSQNQPMNVDPPPQNIPPPPPPQQQQHSQGYQHQWSSTPQPTRTPQPQQQNLTPPQTSTTAPTPQSTMSGPPPPITAAANNLLSNGIALPTTASATSSAAVALSAMSGRSNYTNGGLNSGNGGQVTASNYFSSHSHIPPPITAASGNGSSTSAASSGTTKAAAPPIASPAPTSASSQWISSSHPPPGRSYVATPDHLAHHSTSSTQQGSTPNVYSRQSEYDHPSQPQRQPSLAQGGRHGYAYAAQSSGQGQSWGRGR